MPLRPGFHLSCADFVSPVSPVSLPAKGFAWVWCFLGFYWLFAVFFLVWFVFACLFSVVCFLFAFASLHALALSLTGAQRTAVPRAKKTVNWASNSCSGHRTHLGVNECPEKCKGNSSFRDVQSASSELWDDPIFPAPVRPCFRLKDLQLPSLLRLPAKTSPNANTHDDFATCVKERVEADTAQLSLEKFELDTKSIRFARR